MKARLPVVSHRPESSGHATAPVLGGGAAVQKPASLAALPAADAERIAPGRAFLCVSDAAAPELALRFASRLLEALRARGRNVAVLLVAGEGETLAGDAQRIRQLGVDSVFVLDQQALPDAALAVFATLPSDCIAVGLGNALAAWFAALLSVRLSRTLPAAARGRGLCDVDVELGPSMEGAATLIGDWIAACIPAVSSGAVHASHAQAARK